MPIDQLIQVETLDQKVKLRIEFGDHFVKSPWILPTQAPRMVCRLMARKIESLVKQRKYQISHGLATMPEGYDHAIMMLEYRLASHKQWNCLNIRKILGAMVDDLKIIAPSSGRFVHVWRELIIAIELFAHEEDIRGKINRLLSDWPG